MYSTVQYNVNVLYCTVQCECTELNNAYVLYCTVLYTVQVDEVVDTTGAGDAFVGSLAYLLATSSTLSLLQVIAFNYLFHQKCLFIEKILCGVTENNYICPPSF